MSKKIKFLFVLFLISAVLFTVSLNITVFAEEIDTRWNIERGILEKGEFNSIKLRGRSVATIKNINLEDGISFGYISNYIGFISGSTNQVHIEVIDSTGKHGFRIRIGLTDQITIRAFAVLEYLIDNVYTPSPSNLNNIADWPINYEIGNVFYAQKLEDRFALRIAGYNWDSDCSMPNSNASILFSKDLTDCKVTVLSYTSSFSERTGFIQLTEPNLDGSVKLYQNSSKIFFKNISKDINFLLDRRSGALRLNNGNNNVYSTNFFITGEILSIKASYLNTLEGVQSFTIDGTDQQFEIGIESGTAFEDDVFDIITNGVITDDPESQIKFLDANLISIKSKNLINFNSGKTFNFSFKNSAYSKDNVFKISFLNQDGDGICLDFNTLTENVDVLYRLNKNKITRKVEKNFLTINEFYTQTHTIELNRISAREWEIYIDGVMSLPIKLPYSLDLSNATLQIEGAFLISGDFILSNFLGFNVKEYNEWISLNGSEEIKNKDGTSTFVLNERRFEAKSGDAYSRERLISKESFDIFQPIVLTGSMNWAELDLDSWLVTFTNNQFDDLNIDLPAIWQNNKGDTNFDFLICRPGLGVINLRNGFECVTYTDYSKMGKYEKIDDLNIYRFDIGETSTTLTINGVSVMRDVNIKQSDFPEGRAFINISFLSRLKGDRVGPEEFTIRPINSMNVSMAQDKQYERGTKDNVVFTMTNIPTQIQIKINNEFVNSKYFEINIKKNQIRFLGESLDELLENIVDGEIEIHVIPFKNSSMQAVLKLKINPIDIGFEGDQTYDDAKYKPLDGGCGSNKISKNCISLSVNICFILFLILKKRRFDV